METEYLFIMDDFFLWLYIFILLSCICLILRDYRENVQYFILLGRQQLI